MQNVNASTNLQPLLIPPGAGDVLNAFGDEITVKINGAQSGGAFTLVEAVTQPGGGPPAHVHAREDELFQVLEGRVSFFAGDQWTEYGPGAVVFLPRGVAHTFRNTGSAPSRMSVLVQPSGFEIFFARCAAEFHRAAGPDMERIGAICAEHGIQFTAPAPEPPR